jgi:hypothetical protein
MPQPSGGQIGTAGGVEDRRGGPLPLAAPGEGGEVIGDVLKTGKDVIDELQLKDRSFALGRQAHGHPNDRGFRQGRVPHPAGVGR